ncbi:RICIN domain-containing protein [Streptomyces cinnamoneus]|uniref:helix-turn-helix domain-containing protein n=1 Tax=Streptomyces cinnamoneus TaxID=53446 RepID=UPI00343BE5CA
MTGGEKAEGDPAQRLGSALRALQQRSGRPLRSLQDEVRISDSSLSRYFCGSTVPQWAVVEDLCRALGADPLTYRTLWEAADGNQTRRPAEAGPSDGPASAVRRRLRTLRTGLSGRWAFATAGILTGAVLGGVLTSYVLPPARPAAPVSPYAQAAGKGAAPQHEAASAELSRIFVSRATGACLDDSLDKKLRTYDCNGLSYQRWSVHAFPDGTRQLRNHATGACLEHGSAGLRAVACSTAATPPQSWSVTRWPDDAVELRNKATGACLDDATDAGLRALPCNRDRHQKWG